MITDIEDYEEYDEISGVGTILAVNRYFISNVVITIILVWSHRSRKPLMMFVILILHLKLSHTSAQLSFQKQE